MAKKESLNWEYAPAPESASIAQIKAQYDLFIDGKFVKPSSGKYFATINPATEKKLADVADANAADVDKAVKAARKAFGPWSKLPAKERAKYIYRIARMLQEKAREFAVIETLDGGKPENNALQFGRTHSGSSTKRNLGHHQNICVLLV